MKKNKKILKRKEKGITLIALVITIIVLLILAGVSIAMLTGDNGILTRANDAKDKTEEAALEEKIKLLTAETMINQYTGENEGKTAQELQDELNNQGENVLVVQWDKFIIFDLNKNKEYRVTNEGNIENWGESDIGNKLKELITNNNEMIAVSETGNILDLNDWEYTKLSNNTFALNDETSVNSKDDNKITNGYKGDYKLDTGEIASEIPAFIIYNNTCTTVTSLKATFSKSEELKITPEIPNVVTDLHTTFNYCVNLSQANDLPDSVINLYGTYANTKIVSMPKISANAEDMTSTFYNCTELENLSDIPEKVKIMSNTFVQCKKIENIPRISDNVEDMGYCFSGCVEIKEVNMLPKNLKSMQGTFSGCSKLERICQIPEKVENLKDTFLNCTSLKEFYSIPDSVITISGCFRGCTSLTNVGKLGNKLENMSQAFDGCVNLKSIDFVIPETVTNMQACFINCRKLSGQIRILAKVKEQEQYLNFLANANEKGSTNDVLNVYCNKEVYDIYNADINNFLGWSENNINFECIN